MMAFNSISNSKLHCCLVILIVFILVFLSLPLLLIFLANSRFEETWQSQNTTIDKNVTCPKSEPANDGAPVQCPDGHFPCHTCPDICIHQHRICDGITDCPERWDESVNICYDSNGLIGTLFKRIWDTRDKVSSGQAVLAKPESCDYEMFIQEQCQCNMSEPNVIICEGLRLNAIPSDLKASVFKIRMSNNSIGSLDQINWPRSLTSLVLVHNEIAQIGPGAFKTAPNLSKLYLGHNNISHIHEDAFESAINLSSLQMESNQLTIFDTRVLRHTPAMTMVHLSENLIDLPEETQFNTSPDLKELLLDHNRITIIRRRYFSKMPRLMWLSLTHNEISFIELDSFDGNYELQELNLSFNRLTVIDRRIFAHRLNIQRLYLSGNPIRKGGLPVDAFRDVMELKSLNLTQIEFTDLKRDTFAYLRHLEFIYFEKFRYCHYAAQVRVCRPITDGLSSIEELLAFPILKYAVWIVALVCSLGNVFVFIWRSVSPHEDRTLSMFIKNLSLADLMMGVYLSTIGWQDWKFQNNFRNTAIDWMSSWKCSAIGFLAILSSELSVFILTIITIERYRCIMSTHRLEEAAQKRRARIYVALAWLFSFLIAFYPLFQWLNRKSDFYATNGLCLPLHIDQPFTHGWQYSAFIYLGVNFLAVLVIIALYARMYTMIIDGRQSSRPVLFKAEKREDTILAIRFFFIVVTDCMCWIPIVVIKVMALLRVNISASIYGWLVVFIIPINSALNPIVYTLAAPTTLRSAVCRLFERLCYSLDRLTSGASGYSSTSTASGHGSGSGSGSGSGEFIVHTRRRRCRRLGSSSVENFDASLASRTKMSFDAALLNHNHGHRASGPELSCYGDKYRFGSGDSGRHPIRPGGSKESSFSSTASSCLLRPPTEFNKRLPTQRPVISGKFDCIASYKCNELRHKVLTDTETDISSELHPLAPDQGGLDSSLSSSTRLENITIAFRSNGSVEQLSELGQRGGADRASAKSTPILIDYDGLTLAQLAPRARTETGTQVEGTRNESDTSPGRTGTLSTCQKFDANVNRRATIEKTDREATSDSLNHSRTSEVGTRLHTRPSVVHFKSEI